MWVCLECGKKFGVLVRPSTTFSDLKRTMCPGCGTKQAFILPANRSFTRSPESRQQRSVAAKTQWAARRAIFERAKAAGYGVNPTTDLGAKSETTAFLTQGLLSAINYRRYEQNLPPIKPFTFDPWGEHKTLVTPDILQGVFGVTLHAAALCWRLFRVKVTVSHAEVKDE